MHVARVAGLWRYPIKSLAAEPLERAEVETSGVRGDRVRALVVTNADHARVGKPFRGKEHRLLHTLADLEHARATAARSGVAIDLAMGDRFFDAQPVSLLFDTWLHDVEVLAGRTLDPLRYRPNIFAHAAPGFDRRESELIGATLGIGSVVLQVVAATDRCVTTTYDIATGISDPNVLRAVARHRKNIVGVYCVVLQPGTINRGDTLTQL